MKNVLFIAFAGIVICSCSQFKPKTEVIADQPKSNVIEITNDMEHATAIIPSWSNERVVIAMKEPAAHSGTYACVTNDTIEFGYTYAELVKNINSGLPKKVTITGWVYTTDAKPNFSIVLDVKDNDKSSDWKAYSLAENLTETGKWAEFSSDFTFDKPLNPELTIKLYPWNQSKKPVYVDDLKISFEY